MPYRQRRAAGVHIRAGPWAGLTDSGTSIEATARKIASLKIQSPYASAATLGQSVSAPYPNRKGSNRSSRSRTGGSPVSSALAGRVRDTRSRLFNLYGLYGVGTVATAPVEMIDLDAVKSVSSLLTSRSISSIRKPCSVCGSGQGTYKIRSAQIASGYSEDTTKPSPFRDRRLLFA